MQRCLLLYLAVYQTVIINRDLNIFMLFNIVQKKYGPVGLIHIDAHCDVNEHMNNCAIAHGTTFRRALEDGCLNPKRVVQIGMRGSGHSVEDYAWPMSQVRHLC